MSFTKLVEEMPKYKTNPDIILNDCKFVCGEEAADSLLKLFPLTAGCMLQYCGEPGQILYLSSQCVKAKDEPPNSVTSIMCAVRAMPHLLPAGGKDRLSAPEAFKKLIEIIPSSTPLETVARESGHPKIVAQGELDSLTFHVACEGIICRGIGSLLETLDLLFKFFWVFEITYPSGLQPFFRYLQFSIYGIVFGKEKVPNRVKEIVQILKNFLPK